MARKWAVPDGFCSWQYMLVVKFGVAPFSFPSILFSVTDSNSDNPHVTDGRAVRGPEDGEELSQAWDISIHRFEDLLLNSCYCKEVMEGAIPISGLFGKFCPAGNQNTNEISCPRSHNLCFLPSPLPPLSLVPEPIPLCSPTAFQGHTELVVGAG